MTHLGRDLLINFYSNAANKVNINENEYDDTINHTSNEIMLNLSLIGLFYFEVGKFSQCMEICNQIYPAISDNIHSYEVETLNATASLCYHCCKYDCSVDLCNAILEKKTLDDYDLCDTNRILGMNYIVLCKFDEALFHLNVSIDLSTRISNDSMESNILIFFTYYYFGQLKLKVGSFYEAIDAFTQAKQIQNHLSDHLFALAISGIGKVYEDNGEYQKAYSTQKQALDMISHSIVPESKHTQIFAKVLVNFGSSLHVLGKYEEAAFTCEEAMTLYQSFHMETHIDYAKILSIAGNSYRYLNNKDKMLQYPVHAIKILDELKIQQVSEYADTLLCIGRGYDEEKKYDLALQYQLNALQMFENTFGQRHAKYVLALHSLANVYDDLHEYEKCLETNFKCLKIRKQILSPTHPETGFTLNNIGLLYFNQNDYDQALHYYDLALQIKESSLGVHRSTATTVYLIGRAYQKKGKYEKALEYFLKTEKIEGEIFSTNDKNRAFTYYNIGICHKMMNNYVKALEALERTTEIEIESFGAQYENLAYTYEDIVSVYQKMKNRDKALEYAEKALKIRESHPENYSLLKDILMEVGRIYHRKGWLDRAFEYYNRSINIFHTYPSCILDCSYILLNGWLGKIYQAKSECIESLKYNENSFHYIQLKFGSDHRALIKYQKRIMNLYLKLNREAEYSMAREKLKLLETINSSQCNTAQRMNLMLQ